MEIYGEVKQNIGMILMKMCQQNGVKIYRGASIPGSYQHVNQHTVKINIGITNLEISEGKV